MSHMEVSVIPEMKPDAEDRSKRLMAGKSVLGGERSRRITITAAFRDGVFAERKRLIGLLRSGDADDPTLPETSEYWANWLETRS